MSLFFEGRMNTFAPVTYLSRQNLTVIRPFIYIPEELVAAVVRERALPVVASPCPANGKTKRQDIKELLHALSLQFPDLHEKLLHALDNTEKYNLWDRYVKETER